MKNVSCNNISYNHAEDSIVIYFDLANRVQWIFLDFFLINY